MVVRHSHHISTALQGPVLCRPTKDVPTFETYRVHFIGRTFLQGRHKTGPCNPLNTHTNRHKIKKSAMPCLSQSIADYTYYK